MEVLYHIFGHICGDIPLHRPYIGLIYGRYLQFSILKISHWIQHILLVSLQLTADFPWGCLAMSGRGMPHSMAMTSPPSWDIASGYLTVANWKIHIFNRVDMKISGWCLSLPLWKIWVRQLGWFFPYIMENKTCLKPPTRIIGPVANQFVTGMILWVMLRLHLSCIFVPLVLLCQNWGSWHFRDVHCFWHILWTVRGMWESGQLSLGSVRIPSPGELWMAIVGQNTQFSNPNRDKMYKFG